MINREKVNFTLECCGPDGLVFMDKSYVDEMNSELLISMDYLLDYYGETELKYDYPAEKWETVRKRETELIRNYCNSGKMAVYLCADGEYECEFQIVDSYFNSSKYLHLPTGNLLAINASELIQCALYQELDMEKVIEIKTEEGWYSISHIKDRNILVHYTDSPLLQINNIEEF